MLTFGVRNPTTAGTTNPDVVEMVLVNAAIAPAKFGHKSIGTTKLLDTNKP